MLTDIISKLAALRRVDALCFEVSEDLSFSGIAVMFLSMNILSVMQHCHQV
jgi:hypothetical protein